MAQSVPAQTPAQGQQETLPATVDSLAAAVVVVYAQEQDNLLIVSGRLVREALADPSQMPLLWGRLRRAAQEASQRVRARAYPMAQHVVDVASRNGNASAAREARALADRFTLPSKVTPLLPHDANSARFMTADLASRLDAAAARITRFADDAYRAATVSGSMEQILEHLGKATPQAAQAQAWRELTAKGISGFTDKSGREWNLASYVEMATRTATQRAYNASHRDRLTLAGINYFTISTTGRPCPLCAPWEGKVLADGGAGIATEPNARTGEPFTFHVSATIEEATAAGLFHPNCKHTLTAFLPGATLLQTNQWSADDEAAYKDTQRLRALERAVRTAKLQAAAALTPLEKARALRTVREGQARIRDFTDQTGLLRRPRREQPHLGNRP